MPDSPALDVVHWIRRLLTLSTKRGPSQAGSPLLLTTRGKVGPASRTVIAGWVSTALSAAGITAPPGSVRAAVGSSRAAAGLPLEDILRPGNWQHCSTFFAHYYRPVVRRPASLPPLVEASFSPV